MRVEKRMKNKKIFAAFVAVMSVFCFINTAHAIVLFSDNGNPSQPGWVTSGIAYTGTIGGIVGPDGNPYGVICSAPILGDSYVQRMISTANYQNISLEYNRRTFNAEGADRFVASWSLDGSIWQNLESTGPMTNWGLVSFDLSDLDPAVDNSNLYIRFTMDNGNLWNLNPFNLPDFALFDDVRVTGDGVAPAPMNTPEPATLSLLGLGVLGIVRKIFRKKV